MLLMSLGSISTSALEKHCPPQKPSAAPRMPPTPGAGLSVVGQVAPPSTDLRTRPAAPAAVQVALPAGSLIAAITVITAPVLLIPNWQRLAEMVNVLVNATVLPGEASAFVLRKIPPSPTAAAPNVLTSKLFGLPGSRIKSLMRRLPVAGVSALAPASVMTGSFSNVTVAGARSALVDR